MAVSGGGAAALDGAGHVLSLLLTKFLCRKLRDVCPPFFSQTNIRKKNFDLQTSGFDHKLSLRQTKLLKFASLGL